MADSPRLEHFRAQAEQPHPRDIVTVTGRNRVQRNELVASEYVGAERVARSHRVAVVRNAHGESNEDHEASEHRQDQSEGRGRGEPAIGPTHGRIPKMRGGVLSHSRMSASLGARDDFLTPR